MYPNLLAEMARRKVTSSDLADEIGVTKSTFSLKLNGKYDFSLEEAGKIKEILGVDIPLDELFARGEG